jgi:parvulin-like peptidyl-prolyl isomerase
VGAILIGGIAATPSARADLVDGVVATVGPEVILQSELMQEISPAMQDLRKNVKSEAEFNAGADKLVRQALDQAVEYKILLREATLAGVDVNDELVEQRIAEIKKRFASNEEFEKELTKAGETISDFRTRVRKQTMAMMMGMRKRREFEKAAQVTEADVVAYYDENKDKFTHSERVQLRRIFIDAKANKKERAKVKSRMEALKKMIDSGADFAETAVKNSTGPEAAGGGDMGWIKRKELVGSLDEAAFALPEGGVSNVLDTEFGFVLLKAEKKEAEGNTTFEQARTQIEPQIRAKFAAEKYAKWMAELRKRSRVKIFM